MRRKNDGKGTELKSGQLWTNLTNSRVEKKTLVTVSVESDKKNMHMTAEIILLKKVLTRLLRANQTRAVRGEKEKDIRVIRC